MTAWSAAGCVTVDLHQRQVTHFAPGEALLQGTPPVQLATQPGADIETLKKRVFGHFVTSELRPVESAGPDALTQELEEFVHCVSGDYQPRAGRAQALEAMIVADKVLMSIATHQWDGTPEGRIGAYPPSIEPLRNAA